MFLATGIANPGGPRFNPASPIQYDDRTVGMINIDSLDLSSDIVKIDVEGGDYQS